MSNNPSRKFLTLLSEIIRNSDDAEGLYLGNKAESFAIEVSLKLNDCLKDYMKSVRMLKPHWLRMLVCSKLLTRIIGKKCPPELMTVHDILEHVGNRRGKVERLKYGRVARRRRSNSIQCGECYCERESEDSKRARRTDHDGWTTLHEAVLNGHEKCVDTLLRMGGDAFAKGANGSTPLMCAVATNHVRICRLLLENSGRELLTQVDANGRTAMDLCESRDVYDLLASHELAGAEAIVDLCVELVESYFITHGTLDFWKFHRRTRNRRKKSGFRWDRVRCEIDIQTNIDKLAGIVSNLIEIKELTRGLQPLRKLLDFKNYL